MLEGEGVDVNVSGARLLTVMVFAGGVTMLFELDGVGDTASVSSRKV